MVGAEFVYVGLRNMMPNDGQKHSFKERFAYAYKGKFNQNNVLTAAISAIIFTLIMPAGAPIYAVIIGALAGIVFGKLVFGGLGSNIFNPAAVGMLFAKVCFGSQYKTTLPWFANGTVVAGATPLTSINGGALTNLNEFSLPDMIIGAIPGTLGEVCKITIVIGLIYLLIRQSIDWRIIVSFFGTFGKAVAAYISALLFKLTKAEGHMMFGLTSAHAAGAIAMVMVGRRLLMDDGTALADNNMLNGVVIMILVTCIISTMMTERASQQIVFNERALPDMKRPRQDDEKIMVCVKYPEIAPQLLELAQLTRNQKLKRELVALNVVYDGENSAKEREQGIQLLEQLQRQASASEMQVQTQVRLATNIANGIKHAFRENGCSEIVMGMHVHTEITKKFWGEFIQSLYNGLNRQILLMRFTQPLSTLRRIQVAVPSRAEFEPGFNRWLERLCRFAGQLDCRIQFHGRHESLTLIEQYVNNQHPNVRAEYTYMAHWNELPQLASHIGTDNLLVVVTARKGTISYKTAIDRLPDELTKYFSGTNLMIIFPDQYGNTKEEKMSFTEAQHHEENSIYDTLLNWLQKKRR